MACFWTISTVDSQTICVFLVEVETHLTRFKENDFSIWESQSKINSADPRELRSGIVGRKLYAETINVHLPTLSKHLKVMRIVQKLETGHNIT